MFRRGAVIRLLPRRPIVVFRPPCCHRKAKAALGQGLPGAAAAFVRRRKKVIAAKERK
jgi:hypothetical protein